MTPRTRDTLFAELGGRPTVPVCGRKAMVSAMDPLAVQAAVGVLEQGGSAVDAGVALAGAIAVVSPNWAGLAGDSAWLIHRADANETHHLDGYSVCPAGTTPQILRERFGLDPQADALAMREEPPGQRHVGVVTGNVPGTPAALYEAWKRFGTRPLESLLEPAIRLAEDGFAVHGYLAEIIKRNRGKLDRFESSRAVFQQAGGRWLCEGDILVQSDLAQTLRSFAADPDTAFATGPVAKAIAGYCASHGGPMTVSDLQGYSAAWRSTWKIDYRGHEVVSAGPPTSGVHALQAMQILDAIPIGELDYHGVESLHVLIQSLKLALADRRATAGDPDFVTQDLEALLDPKYAQMRAAGIDRERARPAVPGVGSIANSTTHFVVADADGNLVSVTQTIGSNFGCGEVVGGTGLVMNDRTWWMSLDDGPNVVAAGRRANIGHAPTLVLRDGRPWIGIGSPGGFGIVPYVVQTLVNVIDYGIDIQSAIEAPRFRLQNLDLEVTMEDRVHRQVRDELRKRGHAIQDLPAWTDQVGGVEAVVVDVERGVLRGGYDPRRNSCAAGF